MFMVARLTEAAAAIVATRAAVSTTENRTRRETSTRTAAIANVTPAVKMMLGSSPSSLQKWRIMPPAIRAASAQAVVGRTAAGLKKGAPRARRRESRDDPF